MARGHSGKSWLYLGVVAVLGWMLVPLATGVAQVDWGLIEEGARAPAPQVEPIAPVAPQPAQPPSRPVEPAIAAPQPQAAPAVPAQPAAVEQVAAPQKPVAYKPKVRSSRSAAARKRRNTAALKLRPGFNSYTRPKRRELAREFPIEDDLDIAGILSPRPFVASEPDAAFQVASIFPPLEEEPLPPIREPEPVEDIPVPPLEIESVTVEEEPAPVVEPPPIETAAIPIEDLEPLIIEEPPPPEDQPLTIEVMPPPGFEDEAPLVIDDAAPPDEAAMIESQPFAEDVAPAR